MLVTLNDSRGRTKALVLCEWVNCFYRYDSFSRLITVICEYLDWYIDLMAWNRFRRCGTKSARFKKTHSASAKYMGLLEASKDNRNAQRDGPDAVYAPLHPLTFSWEVPRHHDTLEKVISKGDTNFFFCFVSLSWFWLNIMAVLADNHSGNEPGRRTTKVFITFVVTPALHIISVINFPSTFNSQANAAESDKRDLMKELETIKELRDQTSGMCYWVRYAFVVAV